MNISLNITIAPCHNANIMSGSKQVDNTIYSRSYESERMQCEESFTYSPMLVQSSSRMETYFAAYDAITIKSIDTNSSNYVNDVSEEECLIKSSWDVVDECELVIHSKYPDMNCNVIYPEMKGFLEVDNDTKYMILKFPKKVDAIKI